jgi:hypothetical protein
MMHNAELGGGKRDPQAFFKGRELFPGMALKKHRFFPLPLQRLASKILNDVTIPISCFYLAFPLTLLFGV